MRYIFDGITPAQIHMWEQSLLFIEVYNLHPASQQYYYYYLGIRYVNAVFGQGRYSKCTWNAGYSRLILNSGAQTMTEHVGVRPLPNYRSAMPPKFVGIADLQHVRSRIFSWAQHRSFSLQYRYNDHVCCCPLLIRFLPLEAAMSTLSVTTSRSYKDTSTGIYLMSPGLLQLAAVRSDRQTHAAS